MQYGCSGHPARTLQGPGALRSTASAIAPLVFLLLFLPLAPHFILSMSESLMGEWGDASGAFLNEPGTAAGGW